MKFKQLVPSLLLSSAIVALLSAPTRSQEISSIAVDKSTASGEKSDAHKEPAKRDAKNQQPDLATNSRFVKPITDIPRVNEIERPATSARMLVQSPTPQATPASQIVQVSFVKANPTSKGVELVLQTSKAATLQLQNRTQVNSNSFIVDIPNAQLRLPGDKPFTFRSQKPIAGVTEITVTNFDANTIRVTVIGEASPPIVELFDSPKEGLIFSVSTAASTAQQQPQTQPTQPQTQPGNQTQPSQPSASGDQPIELLVTGTQDGYSVPDATTATRTDTSLRDIPQSIQAIPQTVIKDQQITRISDAARNVSGVTVQGSYAGNTDNYVIRGFLTRNNLRNGFKLFRDNYINPINVERVEVLKGPASILYGQFEPGGVVNYITKQPLATPSYGGELTVGNYGFYRSSLDFSQPLTPDKKLLSRLNFVYENSGSFIDFVNGESFSIAPVLSFQISDNTNLTLEYEHNINNRTFYDGLLPVRQSFQVPISRYLGEPNTADYNFDSDTATITLKHRFSDNLQFRSAFLINNYNGDYRAVRPNSLQENGRTVSRSLAGDLDYFRGLSLQNELVSKFKTGSINHQLLLGLEYSWEINVNNFLRTAAPGLDMFNPVYGAPLPTTFRRAENFKGYTDTIGIYLQDQVTLLPNLKLLVGGRYDFVNYKDRNIDLNNNNALLSKNEYYDEAFSPRVGLVYQPIEPISLYTSYSQSFVPNNRRTVSRSALEPSRGTQYEAGIKTELLDGKLSATLAAYEITKTNVPTTDPNNTDYSIAAGEVKSRGIDLDISGQILPGWNVIASFSHNDTYVSEDNNKKQVGDRLVNAPRNSASLWTTYEIQSGSLKGLGFGAGVFFVGDRQANLPNNQVVIPSFARTDASIFYKKENWRVGLNFKNLFDTKYYESQGFYLRPGAPLTVLGTISVEF